MTLADERPDGRIYRAFWRWHFYAGLLVLPILMLMAATGAAYLFNDEIDAVLYRPLETVEARPVATPPRAWISAAEAAAVGPAVQLTPPAGPGQAARVVVQQAGGARRAVFVDPHDAAVVGSMPAGGVMETVKRLHSLEIVGSWANYLVEIVAGWAIVLVATGIVLWWPRGRKGGVVSVRGAPGRRVFWRDLHAVTGLFAGAVIVFLAASGMPWSAFCGQQARKLTTEAGWGRPPAPAAPGHEGHDALPWTLQAAGAPAAHHHGPGSVDAVVAAVDRAGLGRPYVLSIPRETGKAWSAAYLPDKVEDSRTLYLDGGGMVLADIGYDRYGSAAKAIEWGISVHQGRQFGRLNQFLMLAGCIAIWVLGVSALTMWWKRRPKGRLAAPPPPADRRAYGPLLAVVVPLAVFYPLVGASLLAVLAFDLILGASRRTTGARP